MIQTVEEAAAKFDSTEFGIPTFDKKVIITEDKHSEWLKTAFKAGAAWQKERYKDMAEALENLVSLCKDLGISNKQAEILNAKAALSKALD